MIKNCSKLISNADKSTNLLANTALFTNFYNKENSPPSELLKGEDRDIVALITKKVGRCRPFNNTVHLIF